MLTPLFYYDDKVETKRTFAKLRQLMLFCQLSSRRNLRTENFTLLFLMVRYGWEVDPGIGSTSQECRLSRKKSGHKVRFLLIRTVPQMHCHEFDRLHQPR